MKQKREYRSVMLSACISLGLLASASAGAAPAPTPYFADWPVIHSAIPVDQAITDGNLVSAPAWPAHPAWIAQFLVVLGTRIS